MLGRSGGLGFLTQSLPPTKLGDQPAAGRAKPGPRGPLLTPSLECPEHGPLLETESRLGHGAWVLEASGAPRTGRLRPRMLSSRS